MPTQTENQKTLEGEIIPPRRSGEIVLKVPSLKSDESKVTAIAAAGVGLVVGCLASPPLAALTGCVAVLGGIFGVFRVAAWAILQAHGGPELGHKLFGWKRRRWDYGAECWVYRHDDGIWRSKDGEHMRRGY